MVATDLASRGLDFPFVSHVLNFDFPKSVSDYLHRAGRAGRAGRPGFVISFYREKDEALINEMHLANTNQEPLKIAGSAYSLRNKEKLIEQRKKSSSLKVSLGSSQSSSESKSDKPKYIGSTIAK